MAWLFKVRPCVYTACVVGEELLTSTNLLLRCIVADDILDVTASSKELGKTAGKDESVNKTTYVKLLGLERSKQEARRVVEEAKAVLDCFGDRAIPLKAIADFIVMRKN